ncbi:hypothetical protein ECE50_003160 [Chitinophaga sp. Mgbs1]|uniref:Uncharacterized protein n=1 Tax=Chitinophaga solisilvae TaxID=1233460 RepID=A0A433WF65_9BACT|nr:hypothetical protein [Chitinophaga solisilvae]
MKQLLFICINVFSLFSVGAHCYNAGSSIQTWDHDTITHQTKGKMKIIIGNHHFTAMLYDNAATATFKAILPMVINMAELNDNEKHSDLPSNLPTQSTIHLSGFIDGINKVMGLANLRSNT